MFQEVQVDQETCTRLSRHATEFQGESQGLKIPLETAADVNAGTYLAPAQHEAAEPLADAGALVAGPGRLLRRLLGGHPLCRIVLPHRLKPLQRVKLRVLLQNLHAARMAMS